jgi:hypothetical protein
MAWPKGKTPPHLQRGVRPAWLDNIVKPCDPRAHRIIQRIHSSIFYDRKMRLEDFQRKSGLTHWMVREWFYRAADPRLSTLEAALQVLGYRITIERIEKNDEAPQFENVERRI